MRKWEIASFLLTNLGICFFALEKQELGLLLSYDIYEEGNYEKDFIIFDTYFLGE